MFRNDRQLRREGEIITHISESIQACEIQLKSEVNFNETVCCQIETHGGKITVGVVHKSPSISKEDDGKLHKAIEDISRGNCTIMGDFNHHGINWNYFKVQRIVKPSYN